MFKVLGILLAAYVMFAGFRGEVFAKSGVWGGTIKRTESTAYFWTVVGIYAALSLALMFFF
jgi:hypothetical protein